MDKQLKMLAGAIVVESKLSKGAKKQLLNFIQHEATDIQIKALLLDGEIISNIDEQAEEIIEKRFESFREKHFLFEDAMTVLGTMVSGGAVIMVTIITAAVASEVNRLRKRIFTKAGRACKGYSGNDLERCKNKFKIEALKKEIEISQKGKSVCSKSKDPKKCVSALNNRIIKAKKKMEKIRV